MQFFRILILAAITLSTPALQAADAGTVLITGANRGIGLALAEAFTAGGYTVIGTARSPERATELRELGARVEQLDVTSRDSVAALARTLSGVPIDVLINNAGIGGQAPDEFAKLDVDKMATVLDVNTLGPLRVTQALLPNLELGQRRQVVNVSSMMGSMTLNTWGCCLGYRASKAALNSANTTLSVELGKQGFSFVVVHPGYVQTDMNDGKGEITAETSAGGLFRVISGLGPSDNGNFYDYQGKTMPW